MQKVNNQVYEMTEFQATPAQDFSFPDFAEHDYPRKTVLEYEAPTFPR
jgi:hypothetical protein